MTTPADPGRALRIVGRSSSHFTRMTLIFAEELGLPYTLVPVPDPTRLDPEAYGGNPALKLPTLVREGSSIFGAENVCRALVDLAGARTRVVWPEALRTDLARNAQELVWHGMSAQVQLVFGVVVAELPAENLYFSKARRGFEGALRWLDDHLAPVRAALPSPRDLCLFEVSLFCLDTGSTIPRRPASAPTGEPESGGSTVPSGPDRPTEARRVRSNHRIWYPPR